MKYSKRELKAFNVFALFLFGLGGLFFILGVIEFVFQPTTSYTIVREYSKTVPDAQLSEASAISSSEETAAPPVEESVEAQPQAQRGKTAQETVVVDGTNFKAVSNVLLGVVLLVLSFGLNFALLRVKRREHRRSGVSEK